MLGVAGLVLTIAGQEGGVPEVHRKTACGLCLHTKSMNDLLGPLRWSSPSMMSIAHAMGLMHLLLYSAEIGGRRLANRDHHVFGPGV